MKTAASRLGASEERPTPLIPATGSPWAVKDSSHGSPKATPAPRKK
jgi:hypothetical protein